MKAKLALLALILTFSLQPPPLHAQGSLTPPGAPAPTMKTLDQIEARTPISSAPYVITAPGSYYLTTNVTISSGNAITISASSVMLDLNGFTIASTENPAATGVGILVNSVTNVTIVHGFISGGVTNSGGVYSGSGFGSGILSPDPLRAPANTRVSGVSVWGCRGVGIGLSPGLNTLVEFCTVVTVGGEGINAESVSDSSAQNCGDVAVVAITANNCFGYGSGQGPGLVALRASNCSGYSSGDSIGVQAYIANNCYGYTPGLGDGVNALTANNCYGYSSGSGVGVSATTANNCYGIGVSSQGIKAETANNCYGTSKSNRGVFVNVANGCSGQSDGSSYGLFATSIANACYGQSGTGTGLFANIAIGCVGANNSGPSVIYNYHYNMPP